jgi:Collagen triple helix repeat (20 copies)
MFSAIRKRMHVSPSMVIAVVALVFAATGGAFAMGGGGSPSTTIANTAKAKPKAKAKTGPRGPAGPAGKNGAAGAPGAIGPAGPAGPAGAKGENGAPGAKGESGAAGTAGAIGATGPKGVAGATGSPWTAGGTLPGGQTETGSWSVGESTSAHQGFFVPISFPIQLTAALSSTQVHFINEAGEEVLGFSSKQPSTTCLGTAEAPAATPGNLCVYAAYQEQLLSQNNEIFDSGKQLAQGASKAGAAFEIGNSPNAGELAYGTWAVTAEEE